MADQQIPSIDTLATYAEQLATAAHEAGDRAGENAVNKAIYQLATGAQIVATAGGYLVPSGTRGGVVHRVSESHGCSCEAAAAGRECWHAAAVAIVEAARPTEPAQPAPPTRPAQAPVQAERRNVPRAVTLETAMREIAELF